MNGAGSSTATETTTPLTPQKTSRGEEVSVKLKWIVETLSSNWDLRLELPAKLEWSPAKRSENPSIQQKIVARIQYLCYQDLKKIDILKKQFENEANALYSGWVLKPKAERGVRGVPEKTRLCIKPVSDEERTILLDCLFEILTVEFNSTPKKKRLAPSGPNSARGSPSLQGSNNSPIPFPISKLKNDKRLREQQSEQDGTFKKPKIPEPTPRISMRTSFGSSRSAKTSFTSDAASIFSNPQRNTSNQSLPVFTQDTDLTQESMPGQPEAVFDAQTYRDDPLNTSFQSNTESSEYEGASSFDADLVAMLDSQLVGVGQSDPIIDEELSQDMLDQAAIGEDGLGLAESDVDELDLKGDELRRRLQRVFRKSFHYNRDGQKVLRQI
jgi:hypothetical protein